MTSTQEAIIPKFDDDEDTGRKLAIICSKGNLDMAYPGLILANAALGEGVTVHLFFTFWGFDMITKGRMDDLKFTPTGNTAMHMPMGDVRVPQALAPMPGMQAMATKMMKKSDRRPRGPGGAGVPRAHRGLGRSPVGLPHERGHEPPVEGRPLRRGRGDHQRVGLHRDDRRRAAALHLSSPGTRRARPLGEGAGSSVWCGWCQPSLRCARAMSASCTIAVANPCESAVLVAQPVDLLVEAGERGPSSRARIQSLRSRPVAAGSALDELLVGLLGVTDHRRLLGARGAGFVRPTVAPGGCRKARLRARFVRLLVGCRP